MQNFSIYAILAFSLVALLLPTFALADECSWSVQQSISGGGLKRVQFIDSNTGWAAGSGGTFKTTNGGITWTQQAYGSPLSVQLLSVNFINTNIGWAAGTEVVGGLNNGLIIKSTNGGATWTEQRLVDRELIQDIHFIDSSIGWSVGSNQTGGIILKTINGGTTWTKQETGRTDIERFLDVHFVDANTGWAVGSSGISGVILKTTNGGTTWSSQQSGESSADFYGIYFIDSNVGWVVGSSAGSGIILKTTNGGSTWVEQKRVTADMLEGIQFVNSNIGWAVGEVSTNSPANPISGIILKTTDGGTTWATQQNGITAGQIRGLYFINSTAGWAVGGGTIQKCSLAAITSSTTTTSSSASTTTTQQATTTTGACLQVLTPAYNPTTKECKVFKDSCIDVGWTRGDCPYTTTTAATTTTTLSPPTTLAIISTTTTTLKSPEKNFVVQILQQILDFLRKIFGGS